MNREQKLRNLILDRYTSLRQFAIEADIPYSTLMTLLSRDIGEYSGIRVPPIRNGIPTKRRMIPTSFLHAIRRNVLSVRK